MGIHYFSYFCSKTDYGYSRVNNEIKKENLPFSVNTIKIVISCNENIHIFMSAKY